MLSRLHSKAKKKGGISHVSVHPRMRKEVAEESVVEDVPVETVQGKEPILIGNEILRKGWIARDIRNRAPKATKFVVITDSNVFPLYGSALVTTFEKVLKVKPFVKIIPPGEESKSRAVKEQIEDFMLARACNRDTCVVPHCKCTRVFICVRLRAIYHTSAVSRWHWAVAWSVI